MNAEKKNIVADKSFDFALKIIELNAALLKQNEFVLSRQIMRSGTSIGANIEEAIGGRSKREFIAGMTIALKECRETRYWLRLLERSKLVEFDFATYYKQVDDIFNILTAIITTSKRNLGLPLRVLFAFLLK